MLHSQIAVDLAARIYLDTDLDFFDYLYDVEGKLYQVEGNHWIAWRGTESLIDWWVNSQFNQTKDGKIGIHRGFNRAYKQVRSSVYQATKDMDSLFLTGHSLGGAMAILSGLHLATLGKEVMVYTFGTPKVGSRAFADLCDRYFPCHRYQHFLDLISHLPWGDFEHGGSVRIVWNLSLNPHHINTYRWQIDQY